MTQEEFNSSIAGYVAGNALSKSIALSIKREAEKTQETVNKLKAYSDLHPSINKLKTSIAPFIIKKDINGAADYLSNKFIGEAIAYANNQNAEVKCLKNLLITMKEKYGQVFESIGMTLPAELNEVTDTSLKEILGLKFLRTEDKLEENPKSKDSDPVSVILIGIIMIVIIFLCTYALV